jgi:hypothetical protein
MIERVCGMCGSAWGKSFKFCPADGSVLVAVDTVIGRGAELTPPRPLRQKKSAHGRSEQELAEGSEAERAIGRRPSSTRGFGAPEPAPPASADWVNPVFTNKKSREAAAYIETACHQRPNSLVELPSGAVVATDVQRALPLEGGPKTSQTQRSRLALRVGGDLVQ